MAIKKIDGQKVFCIVKVKASKSDSVGTEVKWTFDFTGCPQKKVLALAARSLVIDVQRDYRAAKPNARKGFLIFEMKVANIKAKRKPKAPPTVDQVVDVMAGMTEAEREAILAKYSKK